METTIFGANTDVEFRALLDQIFPMRKSRKIALEAVPDDSVQYFFAHQPQIENLMSIRFTGYGAYSGNLSSDPLKHSSLQVDQASCFELNAASFVRLTKTDERSRNDNTQ